MVLLLVMALAVSTVSPASASLSDWGYAQTPARNGLELLSCGSIRLCAATDGSGDALATRTPTATWTEIKHLAPSLSAISCTRASLCAATDRAGHVFVSTDPTAGAWRSLRVHRARNPIEGISCVARSLCVGFDKAGNIVSSTHPLGGPQAWRTTTRISRGLLAASCPSVKLCVVAGGNTIATSRHPGAGRRGVWKIVHLATSSIEAVSCPTTRLCVAVNGQGETLTSTDPTGRARAWKIHTIDPNGSSLIGISCATNNLCRMRDSHRESARFSSSRCPGCLGIARQAACLCWRGRGARSRAAPPVSLGRRRLPVGAGAGNRPGRGLAFPAGGGRASGQEQTRLRSYGPSRTRFT